MERISNTPSVAVTQTQEVRETGRQWTAHAQRRRETQREARLIM